MRRKLTRTRVLLTLQVLVVALATQSTAAANEGDEADRVSEPTVITISGGLKHSVFGKTEGSREGHDKAGGSAGPSASAPPLFYLVLPRVKNGDSCAEAYRRYYPDPRSRDVAAALIGDIWNVAARSYPVCVGSTPPESTPAAAATEYWRVSGVDLLPKPVPKIAPGWMLAGKMAFLETGSQPTAHFEHPTRLGLLTIDATATVFVDWGDGDKVDGPHAGPGGPWPNGTITHFWTTARAYDITVSQQWTATWRLGTAAGLLSGLTTSGTIEDFEVRQLQAVINR